MLLQTISMLYLANYHLVNCTVLFSCKFSFYKLYMFHANYICFLQTIISQTVFVLSFLQCSALSYGLVARGADVDLKDFPSIRAHLNSLTLEDVSEILLS